MTSTVAFADQFQRGVRLQANIVFALLFENIRRLSGGTILSHLADPVIKMLVFGSMWTVLGKTFYGYSPYLVMFISFIPHMMFRRGLTVMPRVLRNRMTLFAYPQVKPFDAILSRYFLELGLTIVGSAIVLGILYWLAPIWPAASLGQVTAPFPDPLGGLEILGLVCTATFGVSLIVATYSTLYPLFEQILHFLLRPLIIISLVLHLGIDLPPIAQYYLSWNPLADFNEYFRLYMLGIPKMPTATIAYSGTVSIALLAFGMINYYVNRDRLLTRDEPSDEAKWITLTEVTQR